MADQIGTLNAFTAGTTIVAADVNTNFSDVKTAFNALLTATDQLASGLTANGAFTVASGGLTVTAGGLTVTAGNLAVTAGDITMAAAASQLVPGATSFAVRNNADSADNVLVSDAGVVTVRAGLTVTAGDVTMGAAVSQLVPGATSFSIRNNADSADNLILTDAGAATFRSTVGGITTLTATTLAGTLSTAAQTNVTSVGTLTGLTVTGAATFSHASGVTTDTITEENSGSGVTADGVRLKDNALEILEGATLRGRLLHDGTGGHLELQSHENGEIEFTDAAGNINAKVFDSGGFAVGDGSAIATTATAGFLFVPGCAGTPTGVPASPSAGAGLVALVYDTTNNILYANDGGGWAAV